MTPRHVAVVDIGKTNAKVVLVDLATLSEAAVRRTPNRVLRDGPYPHFDEEHLWRFILDSLADLNGQVPVEAISVAAHGATAALIAADGTLALPILDYEHEGPDRVAEAYDAVRPPFSETGAPRLPGGLNIGAQVFWLEKAFPDGFAQVAAILPYPQYWSFRLSGVAAGEVTSIGAHSDLWNPHRGDYSSLVARQGWARLMPPLHKAGDVLGPVGASVAERTGLSPACKVLCGIHDSNASLLPHLLTRRPPFSVVSTGTWVIAMAIGGRRITLDARRDTLINVNAFGDAVPSARFMGGREFALAAGDEPAEATDADLARVLESEVMLMPSMQPGMGPFPDGQGGWVGDAGGLSPAERHAAVSAYLALMTSASLGLIGVEGPVLVEGPFAANAIYTRVLSAVTRRPVIADRHRTTGTSLGAALLAAPAAIESHPPSLDPVSADPALDDAISRYAARWLEHASAQLPL